MRHLESYAQTKVRIIPSCHTQPYKAGRWHSVGWRVVIRVTNGLVLSYKRALLVHEDGADFVRVLAHRGTSGPETKSSLFRDSHLG